MSARQSARTWKSAALAAGVAVGVALTAQAAQATELLFDLSLSTGDSVIWTQPSAPVPVYGVGTVIAVSVVSGYFPSPFEADFFTSSGEGGLNLDGYLDPLRGAQIFGGSTSAPTFAPGTFDLTGATRAVANETAVLTITAVPEPASWVLMLVGTGGLGAALRATRKSRLVTQPA